MGSLIDKLGLTPPPTAAARTSTTPAAKPAAPSPEAVRFTKHVKELLAKIGALEAQKLPDAARLKKAVVDAAKLGQSAKTRAGATAQLDDIDKQVAKMKADAAKAAAAPAEALFTMKIDGRQLTNVTRTQACGELGKALAKLESDLKLGFEAHCEELKIQREEPFAAWIAGGISAVRAKVKGEEAVDINDLSVWDAPQTLLHDARAALRSQNVEGVAVLVPRIAAATKKAASRVKKHNADSIESAETAVEIARKTEDVAADVIAKGAEKYGGEKAGIAAKAGAKSVFQLVEQLSGKYIAGTQREIDWGAVAKEGAASIASDLVGVMLKGAMAERFSKYFGPYLSKADFSEAELVAMAKALNLPPPLSRDALMSTVQRYAKDFVLSKATSFVTDAVADTIKGKKADEPDMSIDELMKTTAKKFAEGKVTDLFVEFVVEHAKKSVATAG